MRKFGRDGYILEKEKKMFVMVGVCIKYLVKRGVCIRTHRLSSDGRETLETLIELAGHMTFRMHNDFQPVVRRSNTHTLLVAPIRAVSLFLQRTGIRLHLFVTDEHSAI